MYLLLFTFGLAVGSFLNVVSLRYDPDRFLFGRHVIGGRSYCPSCRKSLSWFELVPLVSFIVQRGRCRGCKEPISFQYPLVEFLTGVVFVAVPWKLFSFGLQLHASFPLLATVWVAVFCALILVSLIDLRLRLIPDELNIFILFAGVAAAVLTAQGFGLTTGSFVGPYALLFGGRSSIIFNRLLALVVTAFFFIALILVTRGRGMGVGDAKLAAALSLAFGWPDIVIVTALAFLVGAIVGGVDIMRSKRTLKSFLPFGPFLGLACAIVFFWGERIIEWYFWLIPIA